MQNLNVINVIIFCQEYQHEDLNHYDFKKKQIQIKKYVSQN
jgi:hypothetical protein